MSSSNSVLSQAKGMIENSVSCALEQFQNERFGTVRIVMRNNDPWFVAKDIAECLEISNVSDACSRLDDDEKAIGKADTLGGSQDLLIISESGLYTLIMRSNKPEAKQFRKWVTSEVLPSIRKKGSYQVSQSKLYSYQIEDPIKRAEAWIEEQKANMLALKFSNEQKELAERQRDEAIDERDNAIKTKAWISTKRESTCMNEVKRFRAENETLKEKLGDSANLKAVKSLSWLKEFFRFIDKTKWNALLGVVGREIGKICESNGFRKIRIDDPNWGEVWAYDIKAVEIFKGKLIQDLNYLRKYRIYQDA